MLCLFCVNIGINNNEKADNLFPKIIRLFLLFIRNCSITSLLRLFFILLEMNHSEQYSRNKTYNTYAPDPEETCFNMILNLNTCKSDSKECSRYYRADECCTVSADNHCDCYVCRIYTELVSDTDQNRKKSEEVRICTE